MPPIKLQEARQFVRIQELMRGPINASVGQHSRRSRFGRPIVLRWKSCKEAVFLIRNDAIRKCAGYQRKALAPRSVLLSLFNCIVPA